MDGKKAGKEVNMAATGELEIKSKPRAKAKRKPGSKTSVHSKVLESQHSVGEESRLGDFDDEEKELSEAERRVTDEIDKLDEAAGYSRALHRKAMQGEIQFIEDWTVPDELGEDKVWESHQEQHLQELQTVEKRTKRLERVEALIKIKDEIRSKRLALVTREKQLELEEKRKQMLAQREWLELHKQEQRLQAEWEQQQIKMEEAQNDRRVTGWVTQAREHLSRGDIVSIKSEGKGQMTGINTKATHKVLGDLDRNRSGTLLRESQEIQKRERLIGAPDTGIKHLKRMGMLPHYGVKSETSIRKLPAQEGRKEKVAELLGDDGKDMWERLTLGDDEGKDDNHLKVGDDGDGEKRLDTKTKIKSGKWAKSHKDLVREETWPHVAVLRQYAKRSTFDQMDFETFVAGETRVIMSLMQKHHHKGLGRLRVLCRVAHWMCKCRDWQAVKTIYESIIEAVEMGEREWESSFDHLESLLPPSVGVLDRWKPKEQEKKEEKNKEKVEKKSVEVFWCKDYQKGMCGESGPHMAQLKPDEKPVWVIHICATCWQKDKKKREHQEGDSECPHKKP